MKILSKPIIAKKWITPNSEIEIMRAGRICWKSWERGNGDIEDARGFITRLKKVGHIDVLEEAEMSIWIECSRIACQQITRHRTQHFLQASQRYIEASNVELMIPPAIYEDQILRLIFIEEMTNNYNLYTHYRNMGVKREDARAVLPMCTLTQLKAKANFTNWRRFFMDRCSSTAQHEVRSIANAALILAYEEAPSVFNDLYEKFITHDPDHLEADRVDQTYFIGEQNGY